MTRNRGHRSQNRHNPRTVVTHQHPDLDALASVWAARTFIPGYQDAEVAFVPANWDGANLREEDMAVDIIAGGKGFKGEKDGDGTVRSCFAMIMRKFAPRRERKALAPLVDFIDAQDSTGNAVRAFAGDKLTGDQQASLAMASLRSVLEALRTSWSKFQDVDQKLAHAFGSIFDGMLRNALQAQEVRQKANDMERLGPNGEVAIAIGDEEGLTGRLFTLGALMVVFVQGNNVGVLRSNQLNIRADHPAVRAVIDEAGETDEWFFHEDGRIACRGTRKAAAADLSTVDVRELAEACLRALQEQGLVPLPPTSERDLDAANDHLRC